MWLSWFNSVTEQNNVFSILFLWIMMIFCLIKTKHLIFQKIRILNHACRNIFNTESCIRCVKNMINTHLKATLKMWFYSDTV